MGTVGVRADLRGSDVVVVVVVRVGATAGLVLQGSQARTRWSEAKSEPGREGGGREPRVVVGRWDGPRPRPRRRAVVDAGAWQVLKKLGRRASDATPSMRVCALCREDWSPGDSCQFLQIRACFDLGTTSSSWSVCAPARHGKDAWVGSVLSRTGPAHALSQ